MAEVPMGAKKVLTSERRRRTSAGCLGFLEVWILARPHWLLLGALHGAQ